MLKLRTDHYHNYQEVTDFLNEAQKKYPDLIAIQSIGKTPENRDIWLATLTFQNHQKDTDKPGFWIDANTHAGEITGTESCLYFIQKCLTQYKKDPEITFLLDHVTFYILPRLSADGAEHYLKTNEDIRSSPLPWPYPPAHENFIPKDLNNDGWMLTMRKEDPAGAFKISDKNNELMVQRKHSDLMSKKNKKFYKLFKEGLFQNFDGFSENYDDTKGFDLNRQYPANFRPEGEQSGAGPYPMYLNEAKALVKAFCDRHRIFGHIALHTYGGMVLRPPSNHPDENFNAHDIEIYKKLNEESGLVSGYKPVSTYKDFRYDPRDTITGTTDDWTFEHRGVYAFTIEIWDVWKEAGIEVEDNVSRYFYPTENQIIKIYNWAKKVVKNDFYVKWKPFQHPQLGDVEIGGWKNNYIFRNPPHKILKKECEKVFKIIISQAKATPLVTIKKIEKKSLSGELTRLTVIVENQGFHPTNGSEQALKAGAVHKPTVHLRLSEKLKIQNGKDFFETPHLAGRSRFLPWHSPMWFYSRKNTHQQKFEWLLEGSGTIKFSADYARGGLLSETIKI